MEYVNLNKMNLFLRLICLIIVDLIWGIGLILCVYIKIFVLFYLIVICIVYLKFYEYNNWSFLYRRVLVWCIY